MSVSDILKVAKGLTSKQLEEDKQLIVNGILKEFRTLSKATPVADYSVLKSSILRNNQLVDQVQTSLANYQLVIDSLLDRIKQIEQVFP